VSKANRPEKKKGETCPGLRDEGSLANWSFASEIAVPFAMLAHQWLVSGEFQISASTVPFCFAAVIWMSSVLGKEEVHREAARMCRGLGVD
jgi:hypothetical protein